MSGMNPKLAVWRDRLLTIVIIWVAWALISTFVAQPFKIPSGSMENTLGVGDRIVVEKWSQDVKRGDVVVFADDLHWEPAQAAPTGWRKAVRDVATATHIAAEGNHLVKRVVGLPGDVVSCSEPNAKLTVNGVAVDEPYLQAGLDGCTPSPGQASKWSITVPAGHIWVMGDHRDDSADSRSHDDGTGRLGSVPLSAVTGRAIAVVWPLNHLAGGHGDADAFAKVPAMKK